MRKKILILTLGAGDRRNEISLDENPEKREERLWEMVKNKTFNYYKTNYSFEGKKPYGETEFVAEPLIKEYQPDMVYILGTVKSGWREFYNKYGTENKEHIVKLDKIMSEETINT